MEPVHVCKVTIRVCLCVWLLILVMQAGGLGAERSYTFDGNMPRAVLESYLSRSATMAELLHGRGDVEDNIRMMKDIGTKFAGRAVYRWGGEDQLDDVRATAKEIGESVHRADPEIILQAAVFEIVTSRLDGVRVPEAVFEEFGLKPESRNFRYSDMVYPDGEWKDYWSPGASVPDMSRLETRMWFFHASKTYIDLGVEAIHFGQVEIMDDRDPGWRHWRDMLARVRSYASKHARRHFVLCDAHVREGGIVCDDKLLFDFHSFPLRIDEVLERPGQGVLKMGYLDSIFGRSKGGMTPSGWRCEHLPYIAELDNFGRSGREGQDIGAHWIWGYDEISWFAHQDEKYRNEWLHYAWHWIRRHDPAGFLQMPGSRVLAVPIDRSVDWYFANTPSPATPTGMNQEQTIKSIWAADR